MESNPSSISDYYQKTQGGEPNPHLAFAFELVKAHPIQVAIDCGCGAGRDAAFLHEKGFTVHAFDLNHEIIECCEQRFSGRKGIFFYQSRFESFRYPQASLIVANASLFFCPAQAFEQTWDKITMALAPEGVFCGMFLGPNDTWATPCEDGGTEQDGTQFGTVLALSVSEVRSLFSDFEIVRWKERDRDGRTALGKEKHWHIFFVVAKKNDSVG